MNEARGVALYKYLNYDGAKSTLANCTLKLSSPLAFNDPFDMKLEEALGLEITEFAEALGPAVFEFLSGEIDYTQVRNSKLGATVILFNRQLKTLTKAELYKRKSAMSSMPVKEIFKFDVLQQQHDDLIDHIQNNFRGSGVFCTSKNKNSLLMWSHYADHHRGAVFKFIPDEMRDSALLISKPVRYTRERPLIYRTPEDLIRNAIMMPLFESVKQMTENLIYTKSVEWQYEEEYRLVIPRFIPAGKTNEMLSFYPEELVAVYFGCRIDEQQKQELTILAREVNSKTQFYQASMARREYALEWERIVEA
jgi:Protein of unknown function (DUF2971)